MLIIVYLHHHEELGPSYLHHNYYQGHLGLHDCCLSSLMPEPSFSKISFGVFLKGI